ncbi:MAG: CHAD domain-containing protein [Ignavibacteriae bacterium]|nr:CHAD domain-containing protein [Ignavibacteriota bacterium]
MSISEVFLNRSLAFIFNLEKFEDDPIEENIHQSRVSGRKLESLFEAFGHLSNGGYKVFYKEIVNIIKLLSASREADVCISLTKEYCRQIKVENLIVSNFLNHLVRNSKLQRKRIFKNNEIEDFLNSKDSFEKFIRLDMFVGSEFVSLDAARDYTGLIIPKLYDKVFQYSDAVVNNPSDKKKLHRMRLKAKPLRYLVEFANEVYECNLDDLQFQVKEFVEQAGLIHDIDMLIERVNKFSKLLSNLKNKDRVISKDKSLSVFVKYLNTRRRVEYETFRSRIFKMEDVNIKQKLLKELLVPIVNKT